MKKTLKIMLGHIVFFTGVCLFLYISKKFNITCFVKAIFKTDCPTCGSTRALLSLLKLDFNGYLRYQPMALPLLAVFLLICHFKYVKRKKLAYCFMFTVVILNLVIYIVRQILAL